MSWHFSLGQEEASWEARSLDGAPPALLKLIPMRAVCYSLDNVTTCCLDSPSGTTCERSMAAAGEVVSTWLAAGSHARTSASPAKVTDSTANEAACGPKWRGSFAKWDPDTCTWRTHQCSLLGGYTEFSETWPRAGSMRNGECYQRPELELRTFESASGLLPTPVVVDTGSYFNRSSSDGAALRPTLGAMAKYNLWPTPTVSGNYNRKGLSRDYRGVHRTERGLERRLESSRGIPLNEAAGGLLNPTWVEWLMGWPIGWTALQPLAMDRYREWLQQHGDCFLIERSAEPAT